MGLSETAAIELAKHLDEIEKLLDDMRRSRSKLTAEQTNAPISFLTNVSSCGVRDIEDRAHRMLAKIKELENENRSYRRLLPLIILISTIALNFWLFEKIGGVNYFIWFLKNGSSVSFAASFLALTWEGLKKRNDLLSSHPGKYLAGCYDLAAVFFKAVSIFNDEPLQKRPTNDSEPRPELPSLWEDLIAIPMTLLMLVTVLGWLLVIAPLNYFITLITGSVARQNLHGSYLRAVAKIDGGGDDVTSQPATAEIPANAVDVSLTKNPFAITQALTAMVLWIANQTYERLM